MKTRTPLWAMILIACIVLCSLLVLLALGQGHVSLKKHDNGHQLDNNKPNDSDRIDKDNDEGTRHVGRCVYVNDNPGDPNDGSPAPNSVDAFTANPATGTLTYKGRYSTGGLGDPFVGGFEQHSIVSNGKYLYAVNSGSDDVSAFAINEDCSLRLLNRVPAGGFRPVSLALTKGLLYVANEGNTPELPPDLGLVPRSGFGDVEGSISGFTVRHNGKLQSLPGSTIGLGVSAVPADILFNEDGKVLIVDRLVGSIIDSFRVDSDGILSSADMLAAPNPFGAIFNPARENRLFVALAAAEPGVDSIKVGSHGKLSLLQTFDDPDAIDPCWLAATHDGKWFWTSSFVPKALTLYSVAHNGTISKTVVFSSTISGFPDNAGSTDIALSRGGRFLYQLRAFDVVTLGANPVVPYIQVLRVELPDTSNAGLAPVQGVSLPSDLDTAGTMGLVVIDHPGHNDHDED